MNWPDFALARRYITETRIGVPRRAAVREESATATAAAEAITRQERNLGARRDG